MFFIKKNRHEHILKTMRFLSLRYSADIVAPGLLNILFIVIYSELVENDMVFFVLPLESSRNLGGESLANARVFNFSN